MPARPYLTRAFAVAALAFGVRLHAQPNAGALGSVRGRIFFTLEEHPLGASDHRTSFAMRHSTEGTYGCGEELVATVARAGRTVVVSDWRVPGSPICDNEITPAIGSSALPLSIGQWTLVIRHRGMTDRYAVVIDGELIRVRALATPRISVSQDSVIRRVIPGSFAVRCAASEWFCARAYREVALVPSVRPFALSPIGRNPFGIQYDYMNPPDSDPVHYFMSSADAMETVYSALQRACNEMSGAPYRCHIRVLRWTGESWYPKEIENEHPR